MDKTKYTSSVMIIVHALMAYCWAGKALLSHTDMLICGFSGLVLGVVTVTIEKIFNCHVAISRGIGAFFAALAIIEICLFTGWTETAPITIIASMIPPVATGAMLVEGLCTSSSQPGRKKILNALIISVALALGVFLAVKVTLVRGYVV